MTTRFHHHRCRRPVLSLALLSMLATAPGVQASVDVPRLTSEPGLYFSAPPSTRYDWLAARQYCQQLSVDGRENWQLPSAEQLQALLDAYRSGQLALEGWPIAPAVFLWTDTAMAGETNQHYGLGLYRGALLGRADTSNDYVACVHRSR